MSLAYDCINLVVKGVESVIGWFMSFFSEFSTFYLFLFALTCVSALIYPFISMKIGSSDTAKPSVPSERPSSMRGSSWYQGNYSGSSSVYHPSNLHSGYRPSSSRPSSRYQGR